MQLLSTSAWKHLLKGEHFGKCMMLPSLLLGCHGLLDRRAVLIVKKKWGQIHPAIFYDVIHVWWNSPKHPETKQILRTFVSIRGTGQQTRQLLSRPKKCESSKSLWCVWMSQSGIEIHKDHGNDFIHLVVWDFKFENRISFIHIYPVSMWFYHLYHKFE